MAITVAILKTVMMSLLPDIIDKAAEKTGLQKKHSTRVIDALKQLTDDDLKEISSRELDMLEAQNRQQAELNLADARSENFIQYGWRPTLIWMGIFGIGWNVASATVFQTVLNIAGSPAQLPMLNQEMLLYLLAQMLGFGGLRSLEKYTGLTNAPAKPIKWLEHLRKKR